VTDPELMPSGIQILLSYVRSPNQPPDTSCLDELLPVDFTGYGDRFGVETELGTTDPRENDEAPVPASLNVNRMFVAGLPFQTD